MGRSGSFLLCASMIAACQQAPTSPAKQPDAARVATDRLKRLSALDQLRVSLDATVRKRSPLEAPIELTNAYVDLELAVGYARLGAKVRARALVGHARWILDAKDPIHATLLAEFSARIEAALAGRSANEPLALPLEQQLLGLDRDARYKVDRLREVSAVLAPTEQLDAIGSWINKGDAADPLRGLAGDARATAIQATLDAAPPANAQAAYRVIAALDASLALTPARGAVILRSAMERSASLPAPLRAQIAAEVVIVAAHFNDAAAATSLLVPLEALGSDTSAETIEGVIEAFVELHTPRAIVGLLGVLEHELGPKNQSALFAVAGGWFAAGEKARASAILDGAAAAIARNEMRPVHFELVRALAFAYSNAPIEIAEAGTAEVRADFATVTDSYGTNSHFCLSVIADVEALVRAIAPPISIN